jgi:hypothetical protein
VIKRFGILNHNIPENNPFYGIPFPGQYVVGVDGKVQEKYFLPNHRERVTMETILIRNTDWNKQPIGSLDTQEVTLKYSASQSVVRPGNHITLVLTVIPKKGMHVYAPNVKGYIPISWELNSSDLFRGSPPEYPEAEILYMKALNEKVPVYHKEFRIVQNVEIAQKRFLNKALGKIENRPELAIEATFTYQACDNKTCYLPKTLKLKFLFRVEDHDWILSKERKKLKK